MCILCLELSKVTIYRQQHQINSMVCCLIYPKYNIQSGTSASNKLLVDDEFAFPQVCWGCKEFRRKIQIYLGMIAEVRTDDNVVEFLELPQKCCLQPDNREKLKYFQIVGPKFAYLPVGASTEYVYICANRKFIRSQTRSLLEAIQYNLPSQFKELPIP